ncbi:MAG: reprolysin-like metallopeptidase [Capnocytophaga leadbetteri]
MRNIITIALLVGCVLFGKAQNEADKWLKAVSAQQGIAIEWQERPTSFAKKGIKSFVGYYKGDFVASLSVGKSVSGSFNYQGTSYEISDSKGQLVFYKSEQGICGNQDKEPHKHSAFARPVLAAEEAQPKIANTQVLRVYRLAMHIPYSTFSRYYFDSKIEKVKTFWADTEAFLNEMYLRDLGVRFEVVNDERLIIKDATKETFASTRNASYVKDNSTIVINSLIGENSYDVGISLVYTSSQKEAGIRGLAYLEGVYQPNTKADAVAILTKEVIAHEIGHLFGGRHTFGSHKGSTAYDSEKTELGSGTSVMSYGSPRDFFSLSSIERIRQRLTQVPARAQDKTFATQAPRIDRSKLKNHYTIPKGTFFQFYIPATDPDSSVLLYAVNQHDVRNADETPITQYAIYKPTTTNPVTIKTEYHENSGNVVANSGLAHQTTGTFTFWLGVSDAQPQQAADYIVQYDLAETKVTVKEGTPFEITTTPKNKYKGGEKISLQWKVDAAIFAGTKARVLLSDDLGKTFKHVVLAETANDGAEEVTLPNINTSKAVLKVEVIEGVAFALTDYNPKTGGFTIEKDNNLVPEPLTFVAATLPQDLTLSCAKEVPTAVMPTTIGGCASVSYRMEEKKTAVLCDNRFTLLRIFTATDGCTTLTHTQTIKVADNIPPTFLGTLPQDITIEEGNVTPTQVVLTAADNCGSASVSTTQQTVKQSGKISKLLYIWKAKDACGNQVVYTQTIVFTPKAATPPLAFVATTLPQDLNLGCAKEVPTAVMPTTTGGCASVSYRMEEKKTAVLCDNRFTLLRIFTATDGCNTLTHTQTIKVADNIPPTFVGTLPQDITIEEGEPIPLQKSISAEDTCAGAPTVKRSEREELNEEGKRTKIIYQWVARDVCGNEAVHIQTILITPKKVLPPAANDTAEVVIYNGVSTDDANNYFRIANTDPKTPISVIIFDEMGLKVYESDHYQERGEVFRGYPNVKSVIGSNKALAGTYFYIVKYYKNGKQESAKGFLYVR